MQNHITKMPDNSKIHIYQMLPRLFSNVNENNIEHGTIEENGVGKMNDITSKALSEIKKLGITHIWYTGIIEHATQTDYSEYGISGDNPYIVKGRAGSPYAIKDYYDVSPELAVNVDERMQELEDLIKRTHDEGLKVIIDFVPNHLARAYCSDAKPKGIIDFGDDDDYTKAFDANNNFYYLPDEAFKLPENYSPLYINEQTPKYEERPAKVTGNDVFNAHPSESDWFETVKLNYGVDYINGGREHFEPIPDTWHKMLEVLLFWCKKGVDGFRCDMIEMVPVSFWQWSVNQIKEKYPHCLLIGEAYNPENYRDYVFSGGFDYLYDKDGFYDIIRDVMTGSKNTDSITSVWQAQEGIEQYMLRFLENHDEQRIASHFFTGNAMKGIPAMALAVLMGRGPTMVYFGQELGEPAAKAEGFKGNDGRTSIFDYCAVPELQKWVNNLKFNTERLSKSQVSLRASYAYLLKLSSKSNAIKSGSFYDLQWANRQDEFIGYSDMVYAFLRHHEEERLLIIVSFNDKSSEKCIVRIPHHAITFIGQEKKRLSKITDLNSKEHYYPVNKKGDVTISLTIEKLCYKIMRIN